MPEESKNEEMLPWTGERMVTHLAHTLGAIEHIHRYALALEFVKDKNVLDIASGEGYGTNLLSQIAASATGVDISEEAVGFASKKYVKNNLSYKVGSVDSIPVETDSIDVVVSFETLEHHPLHDEMMGEVRRVLKKDGLLIMSTPEKSIYHRRDPQNEFHVKELTFTEFDDLIKKYFKNINYLEQKILLGSLVKLKNEEDHEPINFYTGDFSKVSEGLDLSCKFANQPFFNICLASDGELPLSQASFFDGGIVYEEMVSHLSSLSERVTSLERFSLRHQLLRIARKVLRPVKKIF